MVVENDTQVLNITYVQWFIKVRQLICLSSTEKKNEKMRKVLVIFLLLSLTFAIIHPLPVQAPTQPQIQAAIAKGVAWLASQQDPIDGRWHGPYGDEATTGLAVLKLEERAYELGYDSPFDSHYEYCANVILGLNYLFSKLVSIGITLQDHKGTWDNPDSNGNGLGVYMGYVEDTELDVYVTGIVLAAISASGTPIQYTPGGLTYLQEAQDMVDWLAWAQSDTDYSGYGMGEGGWAYMTIDNSYRDSPGRVPDNSVSGYAALGLAYAIRFGCTVPEWVKTELKAFIEDIQEDDGGSAYRHPGEDPSWKNILKTGNLIFEMKLVGDTATTPRVINALNYLKAHWNDKSGSAVPPGWDGNPAEYQAMFCAMKGLCYMGIDTFDSIDWYADFSKRIVEQQFGDGSWQETSGWVSYPILVTAWALLTLEKTSPVPTIRLDAEPPVLINRSDPVGTEWQELYPSYLSGHYLAGWYDANNNGTLDRCDYIILDNETGYSGLYHVEDVTVTLRLTRPDLNQTIYVEFNGSIQDFPFSEPENTTWHEVYPEYGNWFNLTNWVDTDGTFNLTSSDTVKLGNATVWHVDAVKTDLLVAFVKYPDFGDAPDYPWGGDNSPPGRMYPSKLFSSILSDGAAPPNITSYWHFQEGSGTIAYDSIRSNNGALLPLINGPAWLQAGAGPGLGFGCALNFDGVNDCVNVPAPPDGSLDFKAGQDFSVQAWIKPSAIRAVATIIDKRQSQNKGYLVYIGHGQLALQLCDGIGNPGYATYFVPASMSIEADGKWHFMFISVDRNKCATFYVDDKKLSIPIQHAGSLENGIDLWIGKNHLAGSSQYFVGGIDEVAIYNRSLTSREVRQLRLFQVRDGASHIDWNYEWLGRSVNGELDSKQIDKDEFDDGVEAYFMTTTSEPIDHTPTYLYLKITISTSGQLSRYVSGDPDKVMYLNAWIDWDQDGDWADVGEKIISSEKFAGSTIAYYSIPVPESARLGGNWLRVRLDYGEDVGANPQSWTDPSLDQYKGQAMFGEVEDYTVQWHLHGPFHNWYGTEYWIVTFNEEKTVRMVSNYY